MLKEVEKLLFTNMGGLSDTMPEPNNAKESLQLARYYEESGCEDKAIELFNAVQGSPALLFQKQLGLARIECMVHQSSLDGISASRWRQIVAEIPKELKRKEWYKTLCEAQADSTYFRCEECESNGIMMVHFSSLRAS